MNDQTDGKSFRIARMSPLIQMLTLLVLALPLAFLVGALFGKHLLVLPSVFLISVYTWVWLRFRPSQLTVDGKGLQVIWPLKYREIPRESIASARVVDRRELKGEIGWGMRIGAGGLWGAFGCLWTKRRGLVQMYVTRTDRFVWIERPGGRPWLITPERPEEFVQVVSRLANARAI
jgi:Bacterial PH domain